MPEISSWETSSYSNRHQAFLSPARDHWGKFYVLGDQHFRSLTVKGWNTSASLGYLQSRLDSSVTLISSLVGSPPELSFTIPLLTCLTAEEALEASVWYSLWCNLYLSAHRSWNRVGRGWVYLESVPMKSMSPLTVAEDKNCCIILGPPGLQNPGGFPFISFFLCFGSGVVNEM